LKAPKPARRVTDLAGDLLAAARRRQERRKPRVRVRIAHGETIVLAADDATGARLLALARDLAGDYTKAAKSAKAAKGGR
jgi:hypothetical protein